METLIKIAGIAIVATLAAMTIKKQVPELSLVLTICAGIAIFGLGASAINIVLRFIRDIASFAGISNTVLTPLLKTVGIAIVTKIATDACKDSGSNSLASYVELAGCAIAITFSLPLLMSVIKLVSSI